MKWYIIEPIDTLFVRTAEPMQMGESHDASFIFPPPTNTIRGAFRTLVLKEKNIKYSEYCSENYNNSDIINSIGKSTDEEPFNIIGPFFKEKEKFYIPAPFCYFKTEDKSQDKKEKEREKSDEDKDKINIIFGKIMNTKEFSFISINEDNFVWVKGDKLESIGGSYISIEDFIESNNKNKDKIRIESKKTNDFFIIEKRIGIALEKNIRKVRESHIYSFPHIRLKNNVSLVIGIDKILPISNSGIIEIGAEKRKAKYYELNNFDKLWESLNKSASNYYMSLSTIKANDEIKDDVVSTGKIQYIGGWDMSKRFHKPIVGYYPVGTIFTKNVKNICIPISLEKIK